MAKYGIPTQAQFGFKGFMSLTNPQIEELVSVFENAKTGDTPKDIAEKLDFSDIDQDIKLNIIQSLFSLVTIFQDSGDVIGDFSNDFIESYVTRFGNLDDIKRESFKNSLVKVIPSLLNVKLTIKAKDLIVSNEKNFATARIFSDIRIVYGDDEDFTGEDQYAVLIHKLRLKYFGGSEPLKEIYFSLDISDLHKLQKVITKAIDKDTSIRKENYKLHFIDPK